MRKINLKSAMRTLVFAIVMLMAGTVFAPQAQASKFRGIVGGHFGVFDGRWGWEFGGGGSASFGVQVAKQFYIGAGTNVSVCNDVNFALFANPRLDLFNVSRVWTPFASGRIGYQILGDGNVYGGIDLGVRRALSGSLGISLSVGFETYAYSDYYVVRWWNGNDYEDESYGNWQNSIAFVTRLSFEF